MLSEDKITQHTVVLGVCFSSWLHVSYWKKCELFVLKWFTISGEQKLYFKKYINYELNSYRILLESWSESAIFNLFAKKFYQVSQNSCAEYFTLILWQHLCSFHLCWCSNNKGSVWRHLSWHFTLKPQWGEILSHPFYMSCRVDGLKNKHTFWGKRISIQDSS